MKARFTNIDIVAAVRELQGLIGLRVTNVYDVDHKSYLFKFAKPDSKVVLLIESGIRLHTTDYEWPKNGSPSGFSMKLRKHVRNRRLEEIRQLGVDRIVDMQFGSREAAYHVILELYDRGNIILTDRDYMVLNILRPRTDQDADVRYAVHEKYPLYMAKQLQDLPAEKEVRAWFADIKGKEVLKKVIGSHLFFGAALVEHALLTVGLMGNQKVTKETDLEPIIPKIFQALHVADTVYKEASVNISKGYITYKVSEKQPVEAQENQCQIYEEFHSFFFTQLKDALVLEKATFMNAVDEFFSLIESQRVDVSIAEQQKQALKKLENVQKDHERRLDALRRTQEKEQRQARLIEENVDLVDRIIVYMRTLMAAELSWPDVAELLERRRERGDQIAEHVINADIATNTVTILLENRREVEDEDENAEEEDPNNNDESLDDVIKVDINLNQSAFQNVTRLHTVKKQAAAKENKTVEASGMALKNAERKTKQALKEVVTIGTITKARKIQWFEKFFWFISTENFLVIGGRDAQQNEMLVKRYMKSHDFYVHADLHGASSVIVKNPSGGPPPPKTLNEAGVMAMSYSGAWEAKMPAKAWWVFSNQVSKTAPSGEYLGTGSFMIRGKKNFLPPQAMVMGFGFLFKIDEESVKNHDMNREMDAEAESVTMESNADDVLLEVEDDSEGEGDGAGVEEPAESAKEMNEGQSFLRSLVSKIISGSGEEENTLITATTSGVVPKAPQQKQEAKKVQVPTKNSNKKIVTSLDKKSLAPPGGPPLHSDDEDWADHKKKKGKGNRPAKNYNQRHQGLPAKPAKKTKAKEEAEIFGIPDAVVEQNANEDEAVEKNLPLLETELETEKGEKDEDSKTPFSNQEGKASEAVDDDVDDDDAEAPLTEDALVLRSFVGNPLPADTIQYCVPICAPYLAMQDCKVKVKLLPGTAKRGKAAKTCFQAFLKDKVLSALEKDVLKSVKDQDMSRNFPGSVKLAIQQQKFKQRRR